MFYEKLDDIMLQFHIKNKDLASAAGLSQSSISKLRRGVSIPPANSAIYRNLFHGLNAILTGNQIMEFEYRHMISWDCDTFTNWIYEDSSLPLPKFSGCLCTLMDLYKIKNNTLAKALNFDSSLISKYRTGKRTITRDHEIVQMIAAYFAGLAMERSNAEELLKVLGVVREISIDEKTLTAAIVTWMTGNKLDTLLADRIFNVMEEFNSPVVNFRSISRLIESVDLPYQNVTKDYGNEGLRKQVILFLSLCTKSKEKLHLKLFSNQSMDWMTEDRSFFDTWKTLMLAVLESGHKVSIIHNIRRKDSESFSAIEGWVPLHLSGNIESYYYALSSSPSFTNTIFISCDRFGLYGNGVVGMEGDTEFFFTKNHDTLVRLESAFDALIGDSSPLLKSLSIKELKDVLEVAEFDSDSTASSIYIIQNKLPVWHLDKELLEEILDQNQMGEDEKEFIISFTERTREFYVNILKKHKIIEYFFIEESNSSHRFSLDCISFDPQRPVYYSAEQYQRHLENISATLKEFENYRIGILDSPMHNKIKLLQLNSRSIFVIKNKYPVSAIKYENEILVKQFQKYIFMKAKSSILSVDEYEKVLRILHNPFSNRQSPYLVQDEDREW